MPLTPGEVVRATARSVRPFGIFFECRGHDLLVLIPETSWTACYAGCEEIARPGDQFAVKVLRAVGGSDQYVGSMRDAYPDSDPWCGRWTLRAGQVVPAKVVRAVERADRCGGREGYLLELRPAAYAMLCAAADAADAADAAPPLEVGQTREVVVTEANPHRRDVRVELKA